MGTGGLVSRIMREAPDLFEKTGILEVLQGPAGKDRQLSAGFYHGMFTWKYSPNVEAAKTFIRWFTTPDRLEPLYKASPGTYWPIYKSSINSDRVKANRLLREALSNVVAHTTDFSFPGTPVPEMGVVDGEKMFASPVNQVVVGAKTPAEAVDDAHKKMAQLFSA
jgi:ABC-type glycerol-3-phosphate transport system substrate-binding protein